MPSTSTSSPSGFEEIVVIPGNWPYTRLTASMSPADNPTLWPITSPGGIVSIVGRSFLEKVECAVVHDGAVVVRSDVILEIDGLHEVEESPLVDVVGHYNHMAVPIFTLLLMPQPQRVTDFVNCGSDAASVGKRDVLLAANHADL